MAAGAWVLHDKIKEYIGDGTVDLDDDAFKCGLALVGSNVDTTSIDGYAAVTSEHAGNNGYTTGGEAMTSVTWVESAGTITFDSANVVWTASGGSITARFGFIYDDTVTTPVADPVVVHCLLDDTPADVTATDTNTLTIQMHASGIFTAA
jgi:hypothetical protein